MPKQKKSLSKNYPPVTSLHIQGLEFSVNLGWSQEERKKKQKVSLDIDFYFSTPPKACETDSLQDTFCYDELIAHIRKHLTHKQFRLLEHLSMDIHQFIRKYLISLQDVEKPHVILRIIKYPKIKGLKNGVAFRYGA